ncbi:DUF3017 domain-containing protein [Oryzihumus sp.]|uniref:DUF3017 domain-containing protein n=1 Tax=Oryzihumus sp. TaxID=1968903 RepID=UPI002EDA256A
MKRLTWVPPRLGVWWVVAVGLVGGVVVMFFGSVRAGGFVFAGSLLLAGMLRLVLPAARAGGLVVRSRLVDAGTLLGLGVFVAAIVATLDLTPR